MIDAGVDQFGGENLPELIVNLVKSKQISEARIDTSVRRLLRQKFELGLFDHPFVDADKAATMVGNAVFNQEGEASQRRAMTLLKNTDKKLPLKPGTLKLYVKNIDPKVAAEYGVVVDKPADADIAIIRLNTPFYPVPTKNPFALMFHHGDSRL